jgi:hypothetical protein
MHLKEQGYVLSIDQASNAAGVSLWFNGSLKATTVLRSHSSSDPFSRRVQYQLDQLNDFLSMQIPPEAIITKILFEGVRARLVLVTVGAFLTCPRIHAQISPKHSFVESSSWKSWARLHGASGPHKDIKGVKALREVGFDVDGHGITSEDISDSVLMYLTWRGRV